MGLHIYRPIKTCIVFDKVTFFYPRDFHSFGEIDELIISGTLLVKSRSKKTRQTYYEGYFKNLRIAAYQTGVYISNSLSSCIYGHNANDLTYNQLCDAVQEICVWLGFTQQRLLIKDFEFGFTIESPIAAQDIIERMLSHHNKDPKYEIRATHKVAVKFYHHNYELKLYDKAFVEKVQNHWRMEGQWLRIEQAFGKKHIPKQIGSAYDLVQKENIQLVFNEYFKQWQKIKKSPFVNHSKFSKEELHRIYALQNSNYIKDSLRYRKKDAVKKEQQRFAKELAEIGDYSIYDVISNSINSKFELLLENQNVPLFPPLLLVENKGQNPFPKSSRIEE